MDPYQAEAGADEPVAVATARLVQRWNTARESSDPQAQSDAIVELLDYIIKNHDRISRATHVIDGALQRSLIHELMGKLTTFLASPSAEEGGAEALLYLLGHEGIRLLNAVCILTTTVEVDKECKGFPSMLYSLLHKLLHVTADQLASPELKIDTMAVAADFCMWTQPPMEAFFTAYQPLPQTFSFLTNNAAVPPHASSSPAPKPNPSSSLDPSSPVSVICYQVLVIMGRCTAENMAIHELINRNWLKQFVGLIALPPRPMNHALSVVQRQLPRTLAVLLNAALRSTSMSSVLARGKLVDGILECLEPETLPNVVTVEVTQLLLYTLRTATCMRRFDMMASFNSDGYNILARNMTALGKSANVEVQKQYIATFCHLQFFDRPSNALESLMYTLNFFNTLLVVFSESKSAEMKSNLLRTIGEVIMLSHNKTEELMELEIFKIFFLQFDGLSAGNRQLVLKIMTRVLSSTAANKFTLLDVELKYYVGLLQANRPSTILLVCSHVTKLIDQKKLAKVKLRESGLGAALLEAIVGVSVEKWMSNQKVNYEEEIKLCETLIRAKQKKEGQQNVAGAASPRTATPPSGNGEQLVMHAVSSSIFGVMKVFLADNTKSQEDFRDSGGLNRLYVYLTDATLRRDALEVISVVASGDILLRSDVVKDLMSYLHGPTSAQDAEEESHDMLLESMAMRTDILTTLRYVFKHNDNMKNSFRENNAFVWVVTVISSLDRRSRNDLEDEAIFIFLLELLDTLAVALRGNKTNQDYFKKELQFSSLGLALHNSKFSKESKYQIRLADALISMMLPSGWPPACSHHQKARTYWHPHPQPAAASQGDSKSSMKRSASLSAVSSLSQARERAATCSNCKDLLQIDSPEIIKLILELLLHRETSMTTAGVDDLNASSGVPSKVNENEVNHIAFILIIKSLKFLVEVSQANANLLSQSDVVLFILTNFKSVLLREKVSTTSKSRQPLLLGLIEKISEFSLLQQEFRKFMELLRSPTCPQNVYQTLITISSRPNIPSSFLFFPKRRIASIKLPNLLSNSAVWPPVSGYTISLWFQVSSYGDTNTDKSNIQLFVLDALHANNTRTRIDAQLYKGILTVRAVRGEDKGDKAHTSSDRIASTGSASKLGVAMTFTFNDIIFEEGRWYHIVLVHAPSTTDSPKKKSKDESGSKKGDILLYIDGKRASISDSNSVAMGSSRLFLPKSQATTSFQAQFGSSGSGLGESSVSNSSWSLGPAILFDRALDRDYEAFLLYAIGPQYCGGLDSVKLSSFYCPELITPGFLDSFPEANDLLLNPTQFGLASLHEHIVFFLNPHTRQFARSLRTSVAPLRSNAAILLSSDTSVVGDVLSQTRLSVKEVLAFTAGIPAILYLIGTAQTELLQKNSLRLLKAVLEWSPINMHQLQAHGGYEIIARVLRKKDWVLDEELLSILFNFVGITRSKKRNTFSDGVIQNQDALEYFLLDWRIWKRAADPVRILLYKSLAEIASTNEHASYNIARMRIIRTRSTLLMMLEEDGFPYHLAQHIVVLISHLMHDPWVLADLKVIFRFLIATHNASNELKQRCQYGVEKHRNAYFVGITCGSRPTLKTLLRSVSSNPSNDDSDSDGFHSLNSSASSLSFNWELEDAATFSTNEDDGGIGMLNEEPKQPVRDLILTMLLDALGKGATDLVRNFFELCTVEVMLAFLQVEEKSTRLLILRIFEVYLKQPDHAARFKRAAGFQLMGEIIRSFPVTEDILSTLFCIMMGKPVSFNVLKFGSGNSTADSFDSLVHPEAVASILVACSSCLIEPHIQHSTVKILHDIFIQSNAMKTALLSNGLIEHLVNSMVVEFEHRIARAFTSVIATGAIPHDDEKSVEEIARKHLVDVDNDDTYTLEEDILRFLQAIAIYGCMNEAVGLQYLQDALLQLHTLPLPYDYIAAVQKRLIYGVLDFFKDNNLKNQPALGTTPIGAVFMKVAIFAVNTFIFLDKNQADSETSTTKKYLPMDKAPLLKRASSFVNLSNPSSPMLRKSTSTALSPPSTGPGNTKSPRNSSTRQVLFHEILQEFESHNDSESDSESGPSTPRSQQSEVSNTISTSSPLSSSLPITPTAGPDSISSLPSLVTVSHSASDDESQLSRVASANDFGAELPSMKVGDLDPTMDSSLSSDSSAATVLHIISQEWWKSAKFLVEDARVVDLLTDVLMTFILVRERLSGFKKLRLTLKWKAIGVSSMSEFDTDLSWHLERLLHHVILDRREPTASNSALLRLVLQKISKMDLGDMFFSESEFLSRSLMYSYPLLSHIDTSVSGVAWEVWKKLLSETSSKLLRKIITFPTNHLLFTFGPGDEAENFKFIDGVAESVKKIEAADLALRKQWNSAFKVLVRDANVAASTKIALAKQLASNCSTKMIEIQQVIIKPLIDFVKLTTDQEKRVRSNWKRLIQKVTHERSIWPIHKSLIRWELDPTEGPMRMRLRLKSRRAHRHPILGANFNPYLERYSRDPKTLYADLDTRKVETLKALESQLHGEESDDDYEMEPQVGQYALPTGETVQSVQRCSQITPFHKRDGELLVGELNCYFMDTHQFKTEEEEKRRYTSVRKHCTWSYADIREIHKRRHMLQNNALEIFLVNGKTYLLAFQRKKERDALYELFMKMELPNFIDFNEEVFVSGKWTKTSITEKWQKGLISNFEYLMQLNTLAGRSFNDLTQYPVFPFVLRDYTSPDLDLTNPNTFRDFSKPMGAQDPQRLTKFVQKYEQLVDLEETPYFYGSHYSNVGSVLHFLVRLEPFSSYFIEFQGGRFDVPDRTFYSLAQSWELSSSLSQSDVKELIPEFFFLPDFLKNCNKFTFGAKQDGHVVDDVLLPPWANGDPRTFVLRHLEALESDYVSENIHLWIDLIFGSAQLGDAAVKALNVFHPYTYEGAVDIDSVTDPLERDAVITQINSYGQTPKQLFKKPHPQRSKKASANISDTIFNVPEKMQAYPISRSGSPVSKIYFAESGQPYALGPEQEMLWPETSHYLQWGHWESTLITAIYHKTLQVAFSFELVGRGQPFDRVSCVSVPRNGRFIIGGFRSSLVRVWRKAPKRQAGVKKSQGTPQEPGPTSPKAGEAPSISVPGVGAPSAARDRISGASKVPLAPTTSVVMANSEGDLVTLDIALVAVLDGHTDAIRCISVCPEQCMFVTGSDDRTAIVWDLNRLRYMRQLSGHEGPVVYTAVHPYWGEIVTVDETSKGSNIYLWTVNGEKVTSKFVHDKVTSVVWSTAKPGLGRDVVITGHENGHICVWSHVDMKHLHTFTGPHKDAVTALSVSDDNTHLLSGDRSGLLIAHATKLSLLTG